MWNWIEKTYLKIFLVIWSLAAFGASVMHLFTPDYLVSLTSWQFAANWQMEIAFFDLTWICCIGYAFITKSHHLQKHIAIVLGLLSIPLGINHMNGYLIAGKSLHLVFAMLNYVGGISGFIFIISAKKTAHSK